jgi:predicted O-methyltransferase YrrM
METRITGWNAAVCDYIVRVGTEETPLMRALREETSKLPMAMMQIGPDQGQLLAFLVRMIGAHRALEIGTFTGYSALAVAQALPPAGKLICCDVSDEWTSIGRRYWQQAGIADRIDLRIAPALETLAALEKDGGQGQFDFAFIDADKENYDAYYEACLRLIRPGGLIAIDNVLWNGWIVDPANNHESTLALRALNEKIRADDRVDLCLVPIGDGVTLVRPH